MKNIKRVLAAVMVLVMAFTVLTACGSENTASETTTEKVSAGMLSAIGTTEEELNKTEDDTKWTFFDTLNALLMALESGKIERANNIPECVGQYVAAKNDKIKLGKPSERRTAMLNYHMGVLEDNTETKELLDKAIKEMKEDGTLKKLVSDYIDGYILENKEDPEVVEIPKIDGAKTLKVAITGDLPPLDFVTADGKAAGFNVAVLAEISKRANVNIELVNVDSNARAVSLTSGKVDVLFWVATIEYADSKLNGDASNIDVPEKVALTESYYEGSSGELTLK